MAATAKPNIVFVLCDNVGWGDFSCYGGGTVTPRIDKLASEGIRFYNYTVESQCTPYRHDDGRPLLGRKLKGKSAREMAYLGLTVDDAAHGRK